MSYKQFLGMDPIRTVQVLRRGIGIVSIAMPFLLIIFSFIPIFEVGEVQISLSAYYYTNIREIFTGTLCIVGFFLLMYQSDYDNFKLRFQEDLLVRVMGIAAIGVALIPTACTEEYCKDWPSFIPHAGALASQMHIVVAALLFLTFAYVSYAIFPVKRDSKIDTQNILVYRVCSILIVISALFIFLNFMLDFFSHMTLVSEIIILLAFGYSWFTKGKSEEGERKCPQSRN